MITTYGYLTEIDVFEAIARGLVGEDMETINSVGKLYESYHKGWTKPLKNENFIVVGEGCKIFGYKIKLDPAEELN